MHTRVNTNDEKVVENVLVRNEYRLPEAFHPEDVIVDIGAHIGSFARACLARGVREIHCYEPHPENYQHLLRNVARYAYRRAKPHDRAVTVTGDKMVPLSVSPDNTGGHSTTHLTDGTSISVPSVGIAEVVDRARETAPNRRIRLLKLDCEGAEYNLLYALNSEFDYIDEITGEIHSFGEEYGRIRSEPCLGDCTREALIEYLTGWGYIVETWNEMSDGLILFRAYREKSKTERGPQEPHILREIQRETEEGADAGSSDTDTQSPAVPGTDDAPSDRSGGTGSSPRLRSRSKRRPTDTDDSTDV